MSFRAKLYSLFFVRSDNPELIQGQLRVFGKQVPLLYGIVIICMLALAYTHFPYAPIWLTIGVPTVLSGVAVARIAAFLRDGRRRLTDEQALKRLRATTVLAWTLGGVFSWWAMSLFQYGTPYTHGHVAFFAGITAFGCTACLMHLRPAAIGISLMVVVPFSTLFFLSGEPVFVAIAINLILVTGAVLFVLFGYSRDFAQLIVHQNALIAKQVETQELSDKNSHLANLDSLTDLPNRRSFFSRLHAELRKEMGDSPNGLAVGIFDLDGFKPINDVYGHPTGDKLLALVSRRLSNGLGDNVFVARLGGDEFGLIISGNLSEVELIEQGRKVTALMDSPFTLSGLAAKMSGTVGLARYPEAADTAQLLFERADYALYHAKAHSSGGVVLFSEKHEAQIREVSGIERRLRDADFSEEMSLAYQPIMDSRTNTTLGFEVLARWTNPVLGNVSPEDFIRAAERAGLINKLTENLFEKAISVAGKWPENLFLSFNLSPFDVGSPECVLRLIRILENANFPAHRVTFEVTETAIMQEFSQALEGLQQLKNIGAKIALDDFGTGYSSLSYVRTLPLHKLKIDRSFITEIEQDETARSIVRTIVDLCRNLKLDCIVEGVETAEQLRLLEIIGCSQIQGYLFSRPMPEADLEDYIDAEKQKLSVG